MTYDPDLEIGTPLERALTLVGHERKRQLALQRAGRFRYTLSDDHPDLTDHVRLSCLVEEIGEVARHIINADGLATDEGNFTHLELRKELAQVAALAVAWIERLP